MWEGISAAIRGFPDGHRIMIDVRDLSKTFKLYQSPSDRLKEILFGRKHHRVFEALKGVSFTVGAGETLGVIGENGAGKSTLLKILTGILLPDSGSIAIDGKITGLLELGTGFNPEFTGVQNIYLNGTLLGMSKGEIDERLDRIIGFCELGDFIDEPLKTYSSGMAVRLGFAVAIHAEPKAFVVDEALSVGDAYFQQKCMKEIKRFRQNGGSIVFVSHDMNAVKVLCDKAMLLNQGLVIEEGDPDRVVNTYNFLLAKRSAEEETYSQDSPELGKPYGNSKIEISHVTLMNEEGVESEIFTSGERCTIAIHLTANEDVENVTLGILIRDRFGQDIFGTNTYHMNVPIHLRNGETRQIEYVLDELNLGPGKYTLTVAAHKDDTHLRECYQWVDVIRSFEVGASRDFTFIGLSRLKPYVRMERV